MGFFVIAFGFILPNYFINLSVLPYTFWLNINSLLLLSLVSSFWKRCLIQNLFTIYVSPLERRTEMSNEIKLFIFGERKEIREADEL